MAEHIEPHACACAVHRLKLRREFVNVAEQGSKVVASTLVLQGLLRPDAEKHSVRVGFTVTKKQGGAVVRNRIRRRLKAAADSIMQSQGVAGWDYVVIGRHTALNAPFDILVRDLRYGVRKLAKQLSSESATGKDA